MAECITSEWQGGFRKGWECVDQIFVASMTVGKYLVIGKKLYATFMYLEKAYDSQMECFMGCVQDIWGTGTTNACVRVERELSESFGIHVLCVVSVAF